MLHHHQSVRVWWKISQQHNCRGRVNLRSWTRTTTPWSSFSVVGNQGVLSPPSPSRRFRANTTYRAFSVETAKEPPPPPGPEDVVSLAVDGCARAALQIAVEEEDVRTARALARTLTSTAETASTKTTKKESAAAGKAPPISKSHFHVAYLAVAEWLRRLNQPEAAVQVAREAFLRGFPLHRPGVKQILDEAATLPNFRHLRTLLEALPPSYVDLIPIALRKRLEWGGEVSAGSGKIGGTISLGRRLSLERRCRDVLKSLPEKLTPVEARDLFLALRRQMRQRAKEREENSVFDIMNEKSGKRKLRRRRERSRRGGAVEELRRVLTRRIYAGAVAKKKERRRRREEGMEEIFSSMVVLDDEDDEYDEDDDKNDDSELKNEGVLQKMENHDDDFDDDDGIVIDIEEALELLEEEAESSGVALSSLMTEDDERDNNIDNDHDNDHSLTFALPEHGMEIKVIPLYSDPSSDQDQDEGTSSPRGHALTMYPPIPVDPHILYPRETYHPRDWCLPDVTNQLMEWNSGQPLRFTKEHEQELMERWTKEELGIDDSDFGGRGAI